MRGNGWLLAAVLVGATGCFPDYEVTEDPPVAMKRMRSNGTTMNFNVLDRSKDLVEAVQSSVTLTYDYDIDATEVTAGRFHDWWDGGQALPANNESLDKGGIYDASMFWRSAWDNSAKVGNFFWAAEDGETGCYGPNPYESAPTSTTWTLAQASRFQGESRWFPMTCVTWFQAVAYCASQGKRLPTAAEWTFARTEGGKVDVFPWGPASPGCEHAAVNADGHGCGFPKGVGSSKRDRTTEGVEDMVGSVFEWLWEVYWTGNKNETDWAGPQDNGSPDLAHLRAGGAYIEGPDSQLARGDIDSYAAHGKYYDAGFRCVKTVPP